VGLRYVRETSSCQMRPHRMVTRAGCPIRTYLNPSSHTLNFAHSPSTFRRASMRRNVCNMSSSTSIWRMKQQNRQPLRAATSRAIVSNVRIQVCALGSGQLSSCSLHSLQKYSKSGNFETRRSICCSIRSLSIRSWSRTSMRACSSSVTGLPPDIAYTTI
jgi:hypothetical protein